MKFSNQKFEAMVDVTKEKVWDTKLMEVAGKKMPVNVYGFNPYDSDIYLFDYWYMMSDDVRYVDRGVAAVNKQMAIVKQFPLDVLERYETVLIKVEPFKNVKFTVTRVSPWSGYYNATANGKDFLIKFKDYDPGKPGRYNGVLVKQAIYNVRGEKIVAVEVK